MKFERIMPISLIGALLWTGLLSGCGNVKEKAVPESITNVITSAAESGEASSAAPESEIETTSISTAAESQTEVTEMPSRVITPKLEWEELEWDKDFMENTIFVGDSVCRALYVYNDLLTTKQVAAVGGGAARNIFEYTFKMEKNEFTLPQAVEHYKPTVVFLWMGMNDINMTEKDVYAENLKNIAEDVIAHSPESKVIILSMSPTAEYHKWNANARIREYNKAAEEMCLGIEDMEIYYLDIQDILSDTEGYLLPECDGGDGMHLSPLAYTRLLSYITAAKDEFMPSVDETTVTFDTSVSEEQDGTVSVTEVTSETDVQ